MSSHHDFSSQEPENLGRNAREVQATTRIGTYNMELAKKAASRARRQERQTSCNHSLTQPPTAALTMAVPDSYLPAPATPTPVRPRHQMFNFPMQGHVPGYYAMSQPRISSASLPPATATDPQAVTSTGQVQEFSLGEDELREMEDDPFANEDDSEHAAAMRSISADEEVLNSFSLANNAITATPVNIRTASLGRRTTGSTTLTPVNRATPVRESVLGPTKTSSLPKLVRRTHLFAPTVPVSSRDSNKENTSTTPTSGSRKRGHSDDGSDDDAGADYEGPSCKPTKLRAGDLNPARRRIFDRAILHFRLQLSKESPYPGDVQIDQWAVKAWHDALEDLITQAGYVGHTAPTEPEVDLIKSRMHQLRGQVRDKARVAVVHAYRFRPEGNAESINYNRELYKKLKNRSAFVYAKPDDRSERGSLYRNKIFREIICAIWYGDKLQSEAVLLPQYFGEHMPLETIAFVATAIEVALNEWKTGIVVRLVFDAKIYQPVFVRHLQDLRSWLEYTTTRGTLSTKTLQFDLCTKAREYAGAMNNDEAEEARLSFVDFEGDE